MSERCHAGSIRGDGESAGMAQRRKLSGIVLHGDQSAVMAVKQLEPGLLLPAVGDGGKVGFAATMRLRRQRRQSVGVEPRRLGLCMHSMCPGAGTERV